MKVAFSFSKIIYIIISEMALENENKVSNDLLFCLLLLGTIDCFVLAKSYLVLYVF